jgi:hypothetical protein
MNTGFEAKGKLVKKGDIQKISDTFSKRDIWMEIDLESDYPQTIKIELVKDKMSLIDKFNVGDSIAIDVNVRGRRVTLKDQTEEVFNSLNGWRLRGNATGQAPAQGAAPPDGPASGEDDLPF